MEAFVSRWRDARPSTDVHLLLNPLTALRSQIHHVHIHSQPDVVGQVPTDVIGIVVNDDVIRIPEPAVAETNIIRSHGEVEPTEPEAAGPSAYETPDVAAAETAGEVAMLPRMIQMVMRVVGAGVMAHPLFAPIDVGSVGMSGLFAEVAVLLGRVRRRYLRRTMCRNVLTPADLRPATTFMAFLLRQR